MPKQMRKHQKELRALAVRIRDGARKEKRIVANVTPGGGKTGAGAIFARTLYDAKLIDMVLWICPRLSLTRQTAESFKDDDFNPNYYLRRADNTEPLVRDMDMGVIGYCTTYQSVLTQPGIHATEVHDHRYLLILDEPHHLVDEEMRSWAAQLEPIEQMANYTLLMTGTPERHDKRPIPFFDYEEKDGLLVPQFQVSYSRKDALLERAIIPINFTYVDGWAEYYHNGNQHVTDLSQADNDESSRALRTALCNESYAFKVVDRCMEEWLEFRKNVYPSRAIVVAPNQNMAKNMHDYLRARGFKSVLAISDSPDSQREISRFRSKQKVGDVLVTVAMAYEGLDVPDCTHMACLTLYRSVSWLEQAFARVTRVDRDCGKSYDEQFAFVYVPDDPIMRKVVEKMRKEQVEGAQSKKGKDGETNGGPKGVSDFVPVGADATTSSYGSFDHDMNMSDSELVELVKREAPSTRSLPAEHILLIADIVLRNQGVEVPPKKEPTAQSSWGVHDEGKLRGIIQSMCSKRDKEKGLEPGKTNKDIAWKFGKSREKMGVQELVRVLTYLNKQQVR
jgi:superfamily II DNA or RNA helicase